VSQQQTSGYDLLVQLSEQELNSQLENFPLAPISVPPLMVNLTFESIELDIDLSLPMIANCVRLRVAALATSVVGTNTITVYNDDIEIAGPLDVITIGNQRVLVFQTAPLDTNFPVVRAAPGRPAMSPTISIAIHNQLRSQQPIPLGIAITQSGSTDPLTPTDMHVKVIDDPSPNDLDCVTLLFNTGGTTTGNSVGVTHYLGNGPTGAVVTLSNSLVLERLIRPHLAAALGATFDPPCVLHDLVAIPTNNWFISYINLETMSVVVEGDHLRAVGTVGRNKPAWWVSGSFNIRLYLVLNNGVLDVSQVVDDVSADFHFKHWVWIVAGLTGSLIGLLITAVIQHAVNKLIDTVLSKFSDLSSKLGTNGVAIPTIPVGLNGGQLQIQSVMLDDLTLTGPVMLAPVTPPSLTLLGDLHLSHTDTTTTANGAPITGLFLQQPGVHYVVTHKRAFRGLFSAALSQPEYPVAFSWTLGGFPITGTGSRVLSEVNSLGLLVPIPIYFQVEGAHCWLSTPAGTSFRLQSLSVTVVDGVGRHSSVTRTLSCAGVVIDDFFGGPVLENLHFQSGHIILDGLPITLNQSTAVIVPIIPEIDRTTELSNAFKLGLAAKPVDKPVAVPASKDNSTKEAPKKT
jgi:hypothetical protein